MSTAALNRKIASMTSQERAERAVEIAQSPEAAENTEEFVKLLFGPEASVGKPAQKQAAAPTKA